MAECGVQVLIQYPYSSEVVGSRKQEDLDALRRCGVRLVVISKTANNNMATAPAATRGASIMEYDGTSRGGETDKQEVRAADPSPPFSNRAAAKPTARKSQTNKAKMKPPTSLSAYNLFFLVERDNMGKGQTGQNYTRDNIIRLIRLRSETQMRRKHRKSIGVLGYNGGFAQLSRDMSAKWRKLDETTKELFEELADFETERLYREQVAKTEQQEVAWPPHLSTHLAGSQLPAVLASPVVVPPRPQLPHVAISPAVIINPATPINVPPKPVATLDALVKYFSATPGRLDVLFGVGRDCFFPGQENHPGNLHLRDLLHWYAVTYTTACRLNLQAQNPIEHLVETTFGTVTSRGGRFLVRCESSWYVAPPSWVRLKIARAIQGSERIYPVEQTPRTMDVLGDWGCGKTYKHHPGNGNYRKLVAQHFAAYQNNAKGSSGRRLAVQQVINGVNLKGGRFLEKNGRDIWVDTSPGRICAKVACSFRRLQSKQQQQTPPETITSRAKGSIFDDLNEYCGDD